MTLANIAEKNWAVLVEDTPNISLKLFDASGMEKMLQSFLQKTFGLCNEEESEEENGAKSYLCWTCGTSYKAGREREFLWHIRECCRNESSSRTTGDANGKW
jgi:hypothetical protein